MQHPMTLEAVAAWLHAQPADGAYKYDDCQRCPFAQYLASLGIPFHNVGVHAWSSTDGEYRQLPALVNTVLSGTGCVESWTFGQAARRARVLLDHPEYPMTTTRAELILYPELYT